MAIPITCPHCQTRMRADDSLSGKYANCGNCGTRIYIEAPGLELESRENSSSASDYRLSPAEDRLRPTDTDSPVTADSQSPTCLKCGAPLSAGQEHCQSCYYHSGLNRVVDTRDDEEQDGARETFGFRKYLQEKLSKGQSPESVFYLLDFFFCLLLLAITIWLSLIIYLAIVPIGLYITYRVIVQTGGHANRGASLLWLTVLFFGRSLEWKTFGGTTRIAVTRRDATFRDSDLAELDNLSTLQVLDLAGTAVSDAGLAVLHQHASLEFIVLRKTSVTEEGVWKLQLTIPATCIWH